MSGSPERRLPVGWTFPPVYARYSVQLGKMLDEKRIVGTHLAPYLRNVDVQWNRINTDDLPLMDFSEEDRERYSLRAGDLLVCEGGEVGRTAIWRSELAECFYQKAIHRVRPTSGHDDPRFFRYFMKMAVDRGDFTLSTASTIQHLTAEKLRTVRYPAPPARDQRAIADYLDRETAQIDSLVASKQRILALLEETTQALVTELIAGRRWTGPVREDPEARWLGPFRADWPLRRLAWLFRERDERGEPEVPLLEVSINAGVIERQFADDRIESTAADFNTYKVARSGDVVFNKMRMWQGAVGVAPVDGLVSPDYVVAEPIGELQSDYAGLLFRTKAFSSECGRRSHGIVWDRLRLYWEGFRDIAVPVPPSEEQRSIIEHISRESANLDSACAATERTVDLLKERRAALISDAVTGRVDHSNQVPERIPSEAPRSRPKEPES